MLTLTAVIHYNSTGPTYTLGTVFANTLAYDGGGTHSAVTLDISSGSLRVRVTPSGDDLDAYAIVNTGGP